MTRTARATAAAAADVIVAPAPASESKRGGALAWTCHGAVLGLETDDRRVLDVVRDNLPVGSEACTSGDVRALYVWRTRDRDAAGDPIHVVRVNCSSDGRAKTVARHHSATVAAELLRHDAEFRVALHAPERLFLHAAALAWEGRAIVIPGHTHAGKSTLSASLLRAGASYLSDEYTIIDADGMVHPFPRALHMRSRTGGPSEDVPVEAFGADRSPAVPIGMVVSTAFRQGERWNPDVMTSGETALALFERAVVARTRPAHAMARIARAVEHGVLGLRGLRGDADETAALILTRASAAFGATHAV